MREQSAQRRKRGGTNPRERDHVKGEEQRWMELNTKMNGGYERGPADERVKCFALPHPNGS